MSAVSWSVSLDPQSRFAKRQDNFTNRFRVAAAASRASAGGYRLGSFFDLNGDRAALVCGQGQPGLGALCILDGDIALAAWLQHHDVLRTATPMVLPLWYIVICRQRARELSQLGAMRGQLASSVLSLAWRTVSNSAKPYRWVRLPIGRSKSRDSSPNRAVTDNLRLPPSVVAVSGSMRLPKIQPSSPVRNRCARHTSCRLAEARGAAPLARPVRVQWHYRRGRPGGFDPLPDHAKRVARSGLMSGDGKRSDADMAQATAPVPDFTLYLIMGKWCRRPVNPPSAQ